MENYIRVKEVEENIEFVNLAITYKSVDAKNRVDMEVVCKEAGFEIENLTSNIQIHSDIVNVIHRKDVSKKIEGDALVTNLKNVPLLIFTADCVPIALIDTKNKAVGLVHAGWRGTFDRIGKKAIKKMTEEYNTDPKDVVCVIGPSIGPCCYEVSEDLVEKFNLNFTNLKPKFNIMEDKKNHLDLWEINKATLEESGVKEENIINLSLCTSCNNDKFHSYRKHKQTPERIGMILQIK